MSLNWLWHFGQVCPICRFWRAKTRAAKSLRHDLGDYGQLCWFAALFFRFSPSHTVYFDFAGRRPFPKSNAKFGLSGQQNDFPPRWQSNGDFQLFSKVEAMGRKCDGNSNGVDIEKFKANLPVRQVGEKLKTDVMLVTAGRLVEKWGRDIVPRWNFCGKCEALLSFGFFTTYNWQLKLQLENKVKFVGLLNPKNRISLDSDIVRPSLSEGLGNSFVRQWRRFADYPARRSAVFWKDSEAGLCEQPNPQNIAEKWNYSWQFTSPKNHRQRSKRWPKIWLGFNCWKRANIVTCGHGVTGFGKTSCLLVKFPYNAFMILLKAKNASQKQFGKNEKNGELPAVFTAKKTTPISVAFKISSRSGRTGELGGYSGDWGGENLEALIQDVDLDPIRSTRATPILCFEKAKLKIKTPIEFTAFRRRSNLGATLIRSYNFLLRPCPRTCRKDWSGSRFA